ncbi:alpha/beta-hydrolase [Eremomyces bilateralis CBS 781.70]|uniref:Alpha/beta-hydrolase n=1 Tax=Eremomyces bilateralis CBS 781.70 TaxID=1392243 RepID=A0A6G1FRA1_9PEZI|nr:alpha/beta-hydrolase [Eremomyces bilateralis CBS 781.70]KAF1808303.1 alpha/beta-hydrolase [Eremomyces bilateralis CBS 781.70]
MADISTVETTLTVPDGVELYTKRWKPTGTASSLLVFVHGFSDHCNAYGDLFPTFARKGIEVVSFDQRGWGRTSPSRPDHGQTGPTSLVISDIASVIESVLPSPVPVFLMGHSMGGGEVLTFVDRGPPAILSQIRGFLVEAPFIAFHPSTQPTWIKVAVGRLAGKLLPRFQLTNTIEPTLLSRDPQVQKDYVEDALCHDTGSLEGLAALIERAEDLASGKVSVHEGRGEGGKTRLWVSHGTADGVCDFDGTKKFVERTKLEDLTFKIYEGWYHKLHAEPGKDRETFAEDVTNWILERRDPETTAKPML